MNQEIDDFKTKVLFVLSQLDTGEVISYGELARQAEHPNHARQVGQILKRLPCDTQLPWHRVVNSKRQISFSEDSAAYYRQKIALEAEGWIICGQRLLTKEAP